jgi:hypothetical protein
MGRHEAGLHCNEAQQAANGCLSSHAADDDYLQMPIGLLIAGPAVEVIGIDTWFFWSGAALIGNSVLCLILTRPYAKETMRPETPPTGGLS